MVPVVGRERRRGSTGRPTLCLRGEGGGWTRPEVGGEVEEGGVETEGLVVEGEGEWEWEWDEMECIGEGTSRSTRRSVGG